MSANLSEVEVPSLATLVGEMLDGGVCSLRFNLNDAARQFDYSGAEGWYLDEDDELVWVTLNIDNAGEIF